MAAMALLTHLFKKRDRHFQLLEASAEEGVLSAEALHELMRSSPPRGSLERVLRARDSERQIRAEIGVLLCEGRPTPLAPEDIEALARALHRIPKGIKKFAERYVLCRSKIDGGLFVPYVELVRLATRTVHQMVLELEKGSRLAATEALSEALSRIEAEADSLAVISLDELYQGRYDIVRTLMLKDLHGLADRIFDRCRDAGTILLQIALKRT